MGAARLSIDERPGELIELEVLTSWIGRLRGLLGTGRDAGTVMLAHCSSVHSFGMAYDLDLAFVGKRGRVLEVLRSFAPGGVASCREAVCVIERPSSEAPWVNEGEHLWIASVSADCAEEL